MGGEWMEKKELMDQLVVLKNTTDNPAASLIITRTIEFLAKK